MKDIKPILDGGNFPQLTSLALRNWDQVDDAAQALPKSKIAAQLTRLDLSMGTLSDTGAQALAQGAAAFKKLQQLVIDLNYVTAAGQKALKAAFAKCKLSAKDQNEDDGDDEDNRYVSVSE